MSKLLVIGDIHGKTVWKDIIKKESYDKVIFLGDYVDTHKEETIEEQIANLNEILSFKEEFPDKVVLLRGNHSVQYIPGSTCCSSYHYKTQELFPKDRYLKNTQWIYIENNIIFSHAGVSQNWMDFYSIKSVEEINSITDLHIFSFTPCKFSDYYGISSTQPPTWIRPQTLQEYAVKGYKQVVGHTKVREHIFSILSENSDEIWLCDALDIPEYLIIDNNQFIIK